MRDDPRRYEPKGDDSPETPDEDLEEYEPLPYEGGYLESYEED